MLQQLGPYSIEREVGRGGMGVVYLGHDPRLGRAVAIKVLPDAFARDPERLARFDREARLLASLNHPNIAGIYGLEEAEGRRFLALEYVEGETLAEHLRRGPLAVEETLDVCAQIAAALEAAHEAGIIHRDLKPGNVKLTPAGTVKVLDFGLAKGGVSTSESSSDLTQSPTISHQATGAGVILGTAAYMSPEQARGKATDRRTDIWSFGCVMLECLTGVQTFAGETISDVIALILQGEPDWSKIPPQAPQRLRELLARCLEKDVRRRLRDIGDARLELEELRSPRSSGVSRAAVAAAEARAAAATAPARPAWQTAALVAALFVAGAAAGIAGWSLGPGARKEQIPLRFMMPPPAGFDYNTDPSHHAISPDGRMLAYSVLDSTGQSRLWVRPLGTFEINRLSGTRNALMPFWSPDSRQIAFFADGKLKRIRVAGGNPEVICDAPSARGGSWNARDEIVFSVLAGPILKVRAGGGTPVAVTVVDTAKGETGHRFPCFLPDGVHFTYAAVPTKTGGFSSFVGSTRAMMHLPLLNANTAPIYAAPGYLIFTRNEALVAQRFDSGSLKLRGDPFTIGEPPSINGTPLSASPCATVSTNGVLAWMGAGPLETRLQWTDRSGRPLGFVDIPLDRWGFANVGPDGRHATLEQNLPSGAVDLWMVDLERGTTNRLTYGQAKNNGAVWSPDGREILFSSTREGPRNVYRRAADGSGVDRVFYESSVPFKDATCFSPDGQTVLLNEIGGKDNWDILKTTREGGTATPLLDSPFNEQNAVISPDGKWMLYESDESGTTQSYAQSFPELGHKQQITKTGAFFSIWISQGKEILVIRPDFSFVAIPVELGPELKLGTPRELFRIPSTAISAFPTPDGQRFLMTVPAVSSPPSISIAVNWLSGRNE